MPYTQAYPLRDSVDSALQAKIDLLKKRGQEGSDLSTYYYTNRTPWISLTSAVNVVGEQEQRDFGITTADELARSYKLTSQFNQKDLPAGHGISDQLGIRPRPGIQNMNITSHNQFGSLRTARVSFQVWSKEDLDACEVLYMRPGMSVLLEWGWSLYLKTQGDATTIHPMERGYNLFDTKQKTLIGVLQELESLKVERGHGYDAIFGFVKNFNWSLRPDGGYDCSTEIMSPGELVESLNVLRPISDLDASRYKEFFTLLSEKKFDEADRAKSSTGGSSNSIARYQVYSEIAPSVEANKVKERLLTEARDFANSILEFEEQTAMSTLLEVDLKYFGKEQLYSIFGDEVETDAGLWQLSLRDLPRQALFAKRLASTSEYADRYQNMLVINFNDPTYALDAKGNRVVDSEGKFEVDIKQIKTQRYVKLGYLLEVMNEFMLRSSDNLIASFDLEGRATFSHSHEFNLSLDPSVCILPGDLVAIQKNNQIKVDPARENEFARNASGLDDTRFRNSELGKSIDDKSRIEDSKRDPIADTKNTILDTYLNLDYVYQLLTDNQISQNTKDGVPVARMFSFVEGLLSGINGAGAGLSDLSLQYYEQEAKYSVIDRKTFAKAKESPTFLDLIGLKSLFYSFNISSALGPELASSIAISAQAKIRSTDSTTAGFLRFNHGIEDRVLTDRKLLSKVVNPEEIFTETTEEDKQRILLLYQEMYGALGWAPHSFKYARELYHEYVNEHYVQAKDSVASRIVIPFAASFEMDGTSGFNILNSFRVSEKLLPYSYSEIKGGIGILATGIEATVDQSKWVTRIKAQMYPLASGKLPTTRALSNVQPEEKEEVKNYVVEYSNEISKKALLTSLFIESSSKLSKKQRDTLEEVVNFEYGRWEKGTKTELEDTGKDKNLAILRAGSRQYAYWKEINKFQPMEWFRGESETIDGNTVRQTVAWSAAYVSYIIRKGLEDVTWPNASSHKQYVDVARTNRFTGIKSGWQMYSLHHDDNVVAQEGDVLVSPREDTYTSSHGQVVFAIVPPTFEVRNRFSNMGKEELPTQSTPYAALAGGNESRIGGNITHGETNRIRTIELEAKVHNGVTKYVYKKNTLDKGKLLVIKRI